MLKEQNDIGHAIRISREMACGETLTFAGGYVLAGVWGWWQAAPGRATNRPPILEPGRVRDQHRAARCRRAVGADDVLAKNEKKVTSEIELVAALQRGDESAFAQLVDRHGAAMLRHARAFERDRAVSEEIVQDAWLGVLRGIERFEGRSSLQTWLLRIVANIAKRRAAKEARSVPLSALAVGEEDDEGPAVAPDRFHAPGARWAGHWCSPPGEWNRPEHEMLSAETRRYIAAAIDGLPSGQRLVISLRDVEGLSSEEVCAILEITESNQRVLLHRARTKVRKLLDEYLSAT